MGAGRHRYLLLVAGLGAALAAVALPAVAGATDYCVPNATHVNCPGGATGQATLEAALVAADDVPNAADRIFIGPDTANGGPYTAQAGGFDYDDTINPLQIFGNANSGPA